jgi:transposase-like protein
MENQPISVDWDNLDFSTFFSLVATEHQAFLFARNLGLIDYQRVCDCGAKMRIRQSSQEKHGEQFVCTAGKSTCKRTKSILAGSWFSGAKVSIRVGLLCVIGYAAELTNAQLSFFAGIKGTEALTNWQNFFRDICGHVVDEDDEEMIGGPGFTVEVDESVIYKRKNNVGRLLANESARMWVFGGICRETGAAFVARVEDRSAESLLFEIKKKIRPCTRIISDFWKSYDRLNEHGYEHAKVNHSRNFVNPEDRAVHTQRVERMWRTLKHIIPKGCSTQTRWSYLSEFVFKQKHHWYSLSIGRRTELILRTLRTIKID